MSDETPRPDAADGDELVAREIRLRELTDAGEVIGADAYRRRSRRAFLTFGGLGVAGYLGFRWVQNQDEERGVPLFVRNGLEFNEALWSTVERDGAEARTFSISDREDIRINGEHGLEDSDQELIEVDEDEAASWEIALTAANGASLDPIPLASIKEDFEVHDMVWEHKCIEGWSNIVHWTGVRVSDVLERYAPDQTGSDWMVMRCPSQTDQGSVRRDYSSAIENYTMMHSQSLFAWQLNGEDLTAGHGSPIRFVTPLKYGIKQLKRLGSIEFTNDRPTDYWTDRGYDLHAGF